MPDALLVYAIGALWACAAWRPAAFVTLLFAAAPWMGLFVQYRYQLDAYKIGLLLLPALFFACITRNVKLRAGEMPWPLVALIAYACLLTVWQLWTSEASTFQTVHSTPFNERMTASGVLFVLRVLGFLAVTSVCLTPGVRSRCASVYVGSVLILAVFGIVQELAYVVTGRFLTFIMRDGIFGNFNETAGAVNLGGLSLMRIYSFSREPKDFALFCLPAIALLIAQSSTSITNRQRTVVGFKLLVILTAGALTFSSSFFILLPAVILATFMVRLNLRASLRPLRQLRWIWALVAVLPLIAAASQERVLGRFGTWDDLLQVSRERPALAFMADNTPRWFAGFGVGSQAFFLPSYMPGEYANFIYKSGATAGVDSFFMALLLDLGLIGALLFLAFVARLLKRSGNQAAFPYRAAFVATLLSGIPFQVDLRSGVLWLFAGLLWASLADRSHLTLGFLAKNRPVNFGFSVPHTQAGFTRTSSVRLVDR
jgi:hypothetical protein